MAHSFRGHGPGCVCCETTVECTIATYSFSSPDTTTIADWTEVAGNWAIVSGHLDPPASGLITWNPTGNPGDMIRWVSEIQFGGSTGTARFIVDYVDASNYHYAEVICTGSVNASVRLWKRSGGTNTALATQATITSFSWSISQPVQVCWEGDIIRVAVGPNNSSTVAVTTAHGGDAVGLATTTTGAAMRFIGPVAITLLHEDCADCPATSTCNLCEANGAPRFLKMVVAGIADDGCAACSELNGTHIATGVSSGTGNSECDGSGTDAPSCNWVTANISTASLCTCWGAALFSVAIYEVAGVFYLTATLSHLQGPTCDENGGGARWHTVLEGAVDPLNCFSALNGVTLPLQCEFHPDDPLLKCAYTGSAITVSLP